MSYSRDFDPSVSAIGIRGNVSRGLRFIERLGGSYGSVLGMVVLGWLGYVQALPNPLLTGVIAIVSIGELIRRMDIGIPILQITAIIAVLQWLVGPILYYITGLTTGRYYMYVDEAD